MAPRAITRRAPPRARFGIGCSGTDPGDPQAARRVFINENTNGTPTESGRRWDHRLDGVWRTRGGPFDRLDLVAGPRLSRFSGQFDFIGGNECFNVVSTQWGLGAGAEASFPRGGRPDFVAAAGLDCYFDARLTGHDASYSPDGSAVNANRRMRLGGRGRGDPPAQADPAADARRAVPPGSLAPPAGGGGRRQQGARGGAGWPAIRAVRRRVPRRFCSGPAGAVQRRPPARWRQVVPAVPLALPGP